MKTQINDKKETVGEVLKHPLVSLGALILLAASLIFSDCEPIQNILDNLQEQEQTETEQREE
jgi:hypothetical protein